MNSEVPNWLPDFVTLSEYDGNWDEYCDALYAIFHRDFVASKPQNTPKPFRLKRHPVYDGKEATFWHLISDGENEEDRTPNMRRCERIAWPRPIIEAMGTNRIKFWLSKRKSSLRPTLAIEDFSYVVVLEEREDYLMLWTAYFVEFPSRRAKLEREYQSWVKSSPH